MRTTTKNNEAKVLRHFLEQDYPQLQDEDGLVIDAIEKIADDLHDKNLDKIIQNLKKEKNFS